MSRIILFSPSLPPSPEPEALLAWRLANSLAESQHEVKIVTGHHAFPQYPTFHSQVEILQAFKSWSIFELIKILPLLIQWHPQAFHLIPPPHMNTLWKLLPHLSDFFPRHDRPQVIMSFWRLPKKLHQLSLAPAKLVTVANEFQKHQLSSQAGFQPPIETLNLVNEHVPFELDAHLLPPDFSPFLLLPGSPEDYESFEQTMKVGLEILSRNPSWHIVSLLSLSSMGYRFEEKWRLKIKHRGLSSRWYFAGEMDLIKAIHLARQGDIIFGAHFRLDSPTLTLITHTCRTFGQCLILNTLQAQGDPGQWTHGENSVICQRHPDDQIAQIQRLIENPDLMKRIKNRLLETHHQESPNDQFTNFFNRTYQSATTGG